MAQTAFFVQYVLHTARWIEFAVRAQFEILSIFTIYRYFHNPMILMTHFKLWIVLPSKFVAFDTGPCLCSGIHPVHTREIYPQQLSKISAGHTGRAPRQESSKAHREVPCRRRQQRTEPKFRTFAAQSTILKIFVRRYF